MSVWTIYFSLFKVVKFIFCFYHCLLFSTSYLVTGEQRYSKFLALPADLPRDVGVCLLLQYALPLHCHDGDTSSVDASSTSLCNTSTSVSSFRWQKRPITSTAYEQQGLPDPE